MVAQLTHWGLVTPYGDRDMDQHWLRQWLVAWQHQAITWTNIDLSSVRSSNILLGIISHKIPQPLIIEISLKITCLNFYSNLPGANELIYTIHTKYHHHYSYDDEWRWFTHQRLILGFTILNDLLGQCYNTTWMHSLFFYLFLMRVVKANQSLSWWD